MENINKQLERNERLLVMDDATQNYLTILPDELKLKIFSYLNTFDIIQLGEIFALEHLTYDANLIRKICLYKEYGCGLYLWNTFVLNKFRREVITLLNINCVYWIPASELRKCFDKMPLLEHFYAVDTKLGATVKDCEGYNSLANLKSLAVTVSDGALGEIPVQLTNLYLHLDIVKYESIGTLSTIFGKLVNLKKLWLIDLSPKSMQITLMRLLYSIPNTLENLTVLFHRVTDFVYVNNAQCKGRLTFKNSQEDFTLMCFESSGKLVNNIYNSVAYENPFWDMLINRMKCHLPFGREDARKLMTGECIFEDMKYEELNLAHSAELCGHVFKSTIDSILTSENAQLLKKLRINVCAAEQTGNKETPVKPEDKKIEPLFKKPRVGVANSLPHCISTLEKLVENAPSIEELELRMCRSNTSVYITNEALSSIGNLNYLTKLTFESVPQHIDGQFLIKVCKSCQHLTSLRLKSPDGNSNFYHYVCLALPYAHALKDFRYQFSHNSLDRIIQVLSNNSNNQKLERLVFQGVNFEIFSAEPFRKFLTKNPQLRLLAFILTQTPKATLRSISKIANEYKTRPEQVFIVTDNESVYVGRLPLPYIHKREMVQCHTNVSVLDIFNDFTKY